MKCNECNEDMKLFKKNHMSMPYHDYRDNYYTRHEQDYINYYDIQYFECKNAHLFVQAIKRDRDSELIQFEKDVEEGIKDGSIIEVSREEFAKEMINDFKGNTRLLLAIEESMNRNVSKEEHVKLTEEIIT